MEVLEILGKSDQSGHRQPIRMSKTTGFPGRNAISSKRGGWQGGSKMQNPREKRGSKWSNAVHFERILVKIARVWAHLSSFSSNSCSKAVQNDHIQATKSGSTTLKHLLGLADADTHPLADEKTSGIAIEDDDALDRANVVHFTRIEHDRTLAGHPVADPQHRAGPGGGIGAGVVANGCLHVGVDAAEELLFQFGPHDQRAVGPEDDRACKPLGTTDSPRDVCTRSTTPLVGASRTQS